MRCREVRPRLVALQDGEVAPSERVQLTEHLEGCPGCRAEYDRLAKLFVPPVYLDVPPEVDRQLLVDVRATPVLAVARRSRPRKTHRGWVGAVAAWLQRDVSMSRGAVLAYATLFVLALLWGVSLVVPATYGDLASPGLVVVEHVDEDQSDKEMTHTGWFRSEIAPQDWRPAQLRTDEAVEPLPAVLPDPPE